jgi:hypothetical protein
MTNPQGISFLPTPFSLGLGLILIGVTAGLCWLAWRRSEFRRETGLLELLRLVLVCLVVATLSQPEWLAAEPAPQQSTLAVLWDRSNSMKTRDVMNPLRPGAEPQSRLERIAPLLTEVAWKPADTESSQDLAVVFEPFSSRMDPAAEATDLNDGLTRVLEKHAHLRGVVLLSDGDWNTGSPPVQAATRFRMQGIPVFPVAVGSPVPLPDLELVSMHAPTFGVAHKALRIPFVLRSALGQDRDVRVTLYVNETSTLSRVVRVPAMGQVQQDMVWTPPDTGEVTLTLRVPKDPQEVTVANNEISTSLSVRKEQLKVLVIESMPRWEYRYLRNALERDPGVEVTCLLFHPKLSKVGGGRGYITDFPSAGELSRFDVVFLGDVGVGPKQLSEEHAQALRQWVSAQAAGLVFIPGRYGWQDTLYTSALADLYPVVLDPAHTTGVGSDTPGHFTLTQAGQRSLLTRLADTDQDNATIWRTLPGFHWYAGVTRAKAGTEVLAVHDQEATASGRVPLIVTKTYGTGKVLFMGTDSAWRWREGVEDRYHYRFWGQVARWMAYRRQMAEGQSMRLFFSPDRPRVDDVVFLNANVLDDSGAPLNQGTVVVQAISPTGRTQTVRLEPGAQDSWGLFVGSLVPREAGAYQLIATCAETGASMEADLTVQGLNRERQGRLARYEVLEEIAAITQGKFVPVSEASRLLDHLATLPEPEPTIHRTRIWSHPVWGGFLIALMGVFWVGRKMNGAV